MVFRKVTNCDKEKIYEMYSKQKTYGTEYCLVTLFEWHKDYNLEAAIGDDYICFRLNFKGQLLYFPPLTYSRARFSELLDKLISFGVTKFAEVTDATLPEFCRRNFKIDNDRDMAEYIYLSDSLITLSGKALHSKRNHVTKFLSLYKYEFLQYENSDRDNIKNLLETWITDKNSDDEEFLKTAEFEKNAILNVLDNLEFYNCFADVLKVDNRIIGFSVGEILPTGVGAVYFEKADTTFEGVYAALNNLFASKHFPSVKYVNRQEDIGDEGLRRAKLSYRPRRIFMKYVASKSEDCGNKFCEDSIELYRESFPDDSNDTVDYFFKNVFSSDRYKEIRDGKNLASSLHIVPKKITYLNKEVFLPFIVGVATKPEYKNKGYASRLMRDSLRCMKAQGNPFAALYPAIDGFYERFGFEMVFLKNEAKLDDFERVNTDNVKILKEIFDTKAKSYEVHLSRDYEQMKLKLGEEKSANLLYKDGKLCGYELVNDNGEIAEYIVLNNNQNENNAAGQKFEPRGMARILDLKAAFSLLQLKNEYKFRLTDCTFDENNGVYLAHGDKIEHSVGFDFTLSERQLCALFFGLSPQNIPQAFIDEFPKSVFVPDKY